MGSNFNYLKKSARGFLDFLFPPLCLECRATLTQQNLLFCPTCLEQLTLVVTEGRCRTCFAELHKQRCERCISRPVVVRRQLAACEAIGPARALLYAMQGGYTRSITAAASLMAYQWLEEKLPLPEAIVPLPTFWWERQKTGVDLPLQLARELSRTFSVPVFPVMKKKFDSDAFLTKGKFSSCFHTARKKAPSLCDRRVLLVAPQLDDALFRSAAQVLRPFFPVQIDGLAFATFE